MKKTLLAFIVIMTVAAALSSCGSSAKAPDGMVALDGENTTYFIYVPKAWTASLSGGAVSAYAEDMSNVSVQTVAIAKAEDGTRLYSDIKDFWENGYKVSVGYAFAKAEFSGITEGKLGGEDSVVAEYTVKVFDISVKAEKSYSVKQVIAEHGDNYYVITYTAETAKYTDHADEFNSIVSNFSFK
ncbi:MAG: hypothetical protein J5940_04790 [Clostridia bacterium]|nr:hypothetical protein [Clostridia bacterium]